MKTIKVHECDVCGDHAEEELVGNLDERANYVVNGFELDTCRHCGQLVCGSCHDGFWCCEAARPKQQELAGFERKDGG